MNQHSMIVPGQSAVSPAYAPDAIAAADPRREIRIGLIIGALFFIGLIGWAAVARLDAAAIAPGRLVVSGQRQTVQHRDGGVVPR
jgi:HlyD family secretion protein